MASNNLLKNSGSLTFNGKEIKSNEVVCELTLAPRISKAQDKTKASSGDTIKYTFTITNPNDTALTSIPFTDAFDNTKASYVTGSFKVGGSVTTPTTTDPVAYTITTIAASAVITIEFSLLIL